MPERMGWGRIPADRAPLRPFDGVQHRRRGAVLVLALAALLGCAVAAGSSQDGRAPAGGTRADYERSARLRSLTEGKVFRTRVNPNWLPDGRFWYRNDLSGRRREFVLVDPSAGTRLPAFDHARLAAALSKELKTVVDMERLPIEPLEFGKERFRFAAMGKSWTCRLSDYTLEPGPAADAGRETSTVPRLAAPRPSQDGGDEVFVTFRNRTPAEVELFWIDSTGSRTSYGKVPPGGERAQRTFAGHVWLAVSPDGRPLAVFQPGDRGGIAVIDGSPPPQAGGLLGRGRVGLGPRGGGRSPDGKWTLFVRDYNLWLRSAEGMETPLSTDGKPGDEYRLQDTAWSPDSRRVAALRTEAGDERKVYLVESSPRDQLQPRLHSFDYLKPGDRVPHPRPQLFDVATRAQIRIDETLFPNPYELGGLRWARDSGSFTFRYNQRGHQVLRIVSVDAATGEARTLVEEVSPTFVDYAHKQFAHWLDGTGELVWMSERSGWNHLYLIDQKTGRVKNPITTGQWVVRGVDRVDEERRQVWFRAMGIDPAQDPYYLHYCRVNLDGTGLVRLTAGDGTHTVTYSPDGNYLLDSYSRVDLPPVTELRRTADGALVCELERGDWSELLATGWTPPERFVAPGRDGKTPIYGVIFRPMRLERGRKYPVLEDHYAGPQGFFTPKAFAAYHGTQGMAELGFIVVKLDGMGTNWRSKAFHDVCARNLGDAGLPDRVAWIRAAGARYPELDLDRVGIYGGSAGGQTSMRALITHGDFYKAAVAGCGCHDNRMDKIWWNELWMGWPIGPHYAEQSNVTQAHRVQGKLMLIVGELDRNVDPASTLQVVNALIRANKDFDLVLVPGAGHGMGGAYGQRRLQDFFVRHLMGVEPRRETAEAASDGR